jgi:trans-2,3-dihydro-3-hydroxyanthranilate isomerase
MSERQYVIADVFTDTPLQGNPLAVFLDGGGLSGELMQRVARELNLSETVFVLGGQGDDHDAAVRIFTPGAEVPFAGHPVLGTAVILAESSGRERVRLRTGSGVVPVSLRHTPGAPAFGEMEQPIPRRVQLDGLEELPAALGVKAPALAPVAYTNGPTFVYVGLESIEQLAGLRPDLNALSSLCGEAGVACFAGTPPRVRMRMFAPGLGVAEDPATGSAAGPLGVHLVRCGLLGHGQPIEVHQGIEIGRPSTLHVRVDGAGERIERVVVGGSAVIVARGAFSLG